MKINKDLIKEGFITERKHKECDYYIYNYSAKTQYQKEWTEDTMNCRGLIFMNYKVKHTKPFQEARE